MILAIALIPLIIFFIVASLSSSRLAQEQQKAKLEAVRTIKASELDHFFHTAEVTIKSLAILPEVKRSMTELGGIVHDLDKKGIRGKALLDNEEYMQEHDKMHQVFKKILVNYGFYDIFFMCKHGDVYYTVTKEPDFGTNMNVVKSGLAESWKHAMKGEDWLTGVEHYPPSNNDPAMFFSTPVKEGENILGVLAIQIPLTQINEIMTENAGMGTSGKTYILGNAADNYTFYSESRFISEAYMKQYLKDPKKNSAILNLTNASPTAKLANDGKSGVSITKDYRNISVISAYQPLKLANQTVILLAEIDTAEAMHKTTRLMIILLSLSVIFVILIILIARTFGKKLSLPIETIATEQMKVSQEIQELAKMNAILASGDWTVQPKQSDIKEIEKRLEAGKLRKDEIGDLYRSTAELVSTSNNMKEAMSQMIDSVSGSLIAITDITEQVASEAAQMNESSLHLSSAATQQAATVEEINATTDEILHNAEENLKNAQIAQEQGHATSSEASAGQDNMQSLIKAMNEIQSSSAEIEKIVKVIDDIAFQTNLLALNAAVEAARAGSHGKGFAVVADEVRSLAGRSAKAAKEITTIINQNNSKIESGNQITETTATTFSAIIDKIKETIDSVDKVTASTSNQTNSIKQISSALADVNDSVQSVSATSEQNASAGEMLANQSDRLDKVVQTFIISSDRKAIPPKEQVKKPLPQKKTEVKKPVHEEIKTARTVTKPALTPQKKSASKVKAALPTAKGTTTKSASMPPKPTVSNSPTTRPTVPNATTKPTITKSAIPPGTKAPIKPAAMPAPHHHHDDDHHDFDNQNWGKY